MNASARLILRLGLVTALTALAGLRLAIDDGSVTLEEGIAIAEATVVSVATYFGIGAATPAEPRLKVVQDNEVVLETDPTGTARSNFSA